MFTAPLPTATRTSIIVERAQALKTLGETYHEDSEDFIQAKKEIMQDTAKRIAAIDKQEKAAKGPSFGRGVLGGQTPAPAADSGIVGRVLVVRRRSRDGTDGTSGL